METYQLCDGTIISTEKCDRKLSKKFGQFQEPVLLLLTLFPVLRPHFTDTMYTLFASYALPSFVTAALAVVMVEDRFGSTPEFTFDDFFSTGDIGVFNIFVKNNRVVPYSDDDKVCLKQLTPNQRAVQEILQLITSAQHVKPPTPEPIVAVEEKTPPIPDQEPRQYVYDVKASDCSSGKCDVCYNFDEALAARFVLREDLHGHSRCNHVMADGPWMSCHLYSHLLAYDCSKILYFGKRSFNKVSDIRNRREVQLPGSKLWFLFRMPWQHH